MGYENKTVVIGLRSPLTHDDTLDDWHRITVLDGVVSLQEFADDVGWIVSLSDRLLNDSSQLRSSSIFKESRVESVTVSGISWLWIRGNAMASAMFRPKSNTPMMTCIVPVMILEPPEPPTTMYKSSSFRTIVGVIEDNGRFPGWM